MQTVIQVPIESIYADLPVFAALAVWNLLVLLVLSKKVYELALKKEDQPILQCISPEKQSIF